MIEIWREGFIATGDDQPAHMMAREPAASLQEACDQIAARDPEFAKYYDRERMTYWGCRLFDNEADARRFNG